MSDAGQQRQLEGGNAEEKRRSMQRCPDSHIVQRAAARFIRSRKEACSGIGGLHASARWHTAGRPVLYTAQCKSRIAVSRAFGDAWLDARTTPALLVPTIITPGEWNVLINPVHPQFSSKWIVSGPEVYTFDARLLPARGKARSQRTSRPQ